MGVHFVDNKLVITTEPKTFCFDLPKDASINLKHEIYSFIKHNKHLAEHPIKSDIIVNYCRNISMEMIFMNTENNKSVNRTNSFSTSHRD